MPPLWLANSIDEIGGGMATALQIMAYHFGARMQARWKHVSLALFATLLSCRTMAPHESGFLIRSIAVRGSTYLYSIYVPRSWDSSKRWPVILFLHGSGERGTDGLRSTQIGVAAAIRANPERVPAIVVFPQAPPDTRWLDEPADVAMAALGATIAEFHGDPDRVYLTGLSMGGYGTYHLALAHPRKFAALFVVCGGLLPHATTTAVQQSPLTRDTADPYAFTAHALRSLPIWICHGDADPVIPVEESRRMAEQLRRDGADVRYSEYPGVGHNAWDRAYGDAEVWRWLFMQRRKGDRPQTIGGRSGH
jgi:predicted peptidase